MWDKPSTDKQKKCILWICDVLGIDFDNYARSYYNNRLDAHEFIHNNYKEACRVQKEKEIEIGKKVYK